MDQILGINLNPITSSNTSNSGAGRGNASGSGSGSGTLTASHNAPNQQLNNSGSQNGSGSASGSSAMPAHKNGNKQGGPTVWPLTASASGSGSCNYNTTVQFGDTGYISTAEEVNCAPPTIQVPIIVGNPGTCPVYVSYSTQDGTALAGTDYTAASGTAGFPAGSTGPYWVSIPILDDGTDESAGNEVFYVNLSSAQNATIGGDNPFRVYISEPTPQGSPDTLVWNPCPNNYASDPLNWYDQTLGRQLQDGDPGPGPGTPIIFDANPNDTPNSNAPITWDQSYTVASVTIEGGYHAVQTVNYGVGLEMDGANGTTLTVDASSTGDFNL